ncbi:MAG: hypothetical protein K2Q24_03785 [Chitinophagaceae bacterium]|jgi:hypothetical protein|nr:hypothetical protein [Chitinophagaceae bacterium]
MTLVIKKGASPKEIEAITLKLSKGKKKKGFNAYKHCGVIKLKTDALAIQKKLRNEWK